MTKTDDYFGIDKLYHFTAGIAICVILGSLMIPVVGLSVAVVVGVLKELYDYHHPAKHTTSFWDLLWTVAGAIIGFGIFYVL